MAAKSTILLLLIVCFLKLSAQTDASTLTKTGDKAPDISLQVEKGKFKNLSSYKGKVVLINFFATWCPPCVEEMPRIQKDIWEKYQASPQFALFVLGREQDWDKLDPYKKKNNYTFSLLPDISRKAFSKYATQSIPRSVLINEEGIIVYQSIGYSPEEFAKLLSVLSSLLQ